jgi:hypothetical protein
VSEAKHVSKKINPVTRRVAKDQLTPGEVAVLMRVVRAHSVQEVDLVAPKVCELDTDIIRSHPPWNGVITLPESWAIEKEPL